ncbi:MAG: DNA methylase, partial [Paludibacteraceae bacterium]|nr:DNA methylase [Paludibacteraceae bacterium]
DLFSDAEALQKQREAEKKSLSRERRMQEAVLSIKHRYGKNAILKGLNFEEGSTARERNTQIGGHKG